MTKLVNCVFSSQFECSLNLKSKATRIYVLHDFIYLRYKVCVYTWGYPLPWERRVTGRCVERPLRTRCCGSCDMNVDSLWKSLTCTFLICIFFYITLLCQKDPENVNHGIPQEMPRIRICGSVTCGPYLFILIPFATFS